MSYRPNEPHGVDSTASTTVSSRTRLFGVANSPLLKSGFNKLNLMNEALARVRMRELWRPERRHKRRAMAMFSVDRDRVRRRY